MPRLNGLVALAVVAAAAATRVAAEPSLATTDIEERLRRLEALEREDRAERGARIFARSCAACHGGDGRGDGPGAADLHPPPRDLARGGIRFRSTSTGSPPRAEDLVRTIREGLPGTAMPAFGHLLSGEQIEELIDFVNGLRDGEISLASAPLAIGEVPPADPGVIEEGRAVYLLAGCSACHGLDGSGRGPSAGAMTDEQGRPMRMPDFRRDPLKGGRDPQAIVRTLRTGLNGAPMPSFDEAMLFSANDYADPDLLPAGIDEEDRALLEVYLADVPRRADVAAMDPAARASLRDRRLGALARYVRSLDHRRGFTYRLFHEKPEQNRRKGP